MFRKRFSFAGSVMPHLLASALLINVVCAPFVAAEQASGGFPLGGEFRNFNTSDHTFIHRFLKSGEYMPVSDIRPGMEGYGLTVFQGTKIERFNVKVIGTVKKVLNNRDAILVRLSGGQMAKNNVIKGMSGSPVYIGGKLIGAISYGFDFSTEPIAGVTPIVDMLDALAQDTDHGAAPDRISKVDLPTVPASVVQTAGGARPTTVAGAAPHMVPLMAPVALAGFSPRAEKFLSERFNEFGLYCSSGAAGGMDESLANKKKVGSVSKDTIVPGGAVSVMLTTGDFNTSACGTATATFNGKVLAFGHPFLQAGVVDFPMASAYIHQVMPSLAVSFKVSSPMQVLGAIVSDRPWAVGGQLGKTARLIPATYTVTDETRHLQHTYHCSIVDHPDLTPELMAATAMSAIDATHQSSAPYILKVASAIETSDGDVIKRTDRYPTNFSAHSGSFEGMSRLKGLLDPVGGYLLSTGTKIMDNEFQKVSIKSINLQIALEDGHKAAKLERIYVDNPIVEPGDTIKVNCVIRPYDKERVTKTIDLKVPRDVPDGNLLLAVSSGDEMDMVRKRLGLVDPPAETLKQVMNKIRIRGRGDSLCALLALPEQSISINGVTLLNPPAHWDKLFFSDRYTRGPALTRGEIKVSAVQDYLLDGAHVMTVEVRRPEKASARSQPYMVSQSSGTASDSIVMTDLAKKTINKSDIGSSSSSSSSSAATSTSSSTATASSSLSTSTSSDKTAAAATASNPYWSSAKDKDYPHMRSLQLWRQETEEEFRNGKTDSTTIDSWGRIIPGFQDLNKFKFNDDMRIWSATWSNGYFWFSTSNKIFKWNPGSGAPAPELVAELDAVAIPSVVADSKGIIYAAAIPGAQVYAIDPTKPSKQNATLLIKLWEPLVTSLAVDAQDNLFIGVTGTGKVYKLPPATHLPVDPSTLTSIFDSGQASVVSMFYCRPENKLYVGTGEKGAVYSIDSSGKAQAEYQSADHIVTGLAKDSKGNLYVATAGQGHLVKVNKTGQVENLASSEAFYTLYYDTASDTVLSGDAEGDITQAQYDALSNQSYFIPVCHTEQDAVLALSTDGKGKMFAGTCNLAVARLFEMKPAAKASYTSEVHEASRAAKWSRLRAYGGYNEMSDAIKNAVLVQTRTGQTSQPDASWSSWIAAQYEHDAYVLNSPSGRYMQYRLVWKQDDNAKERPVAIGKVDVTYLPNNSTPQFSSVSIKSGSAFSGKQDISVTGTDSDGDNLLLSMELSADGGKTWLPLATNVRSKQPVKDVAAASVTTTSTTSTTVNTSTDKPKTKNGSTDTNPLPPEVVPSPDHPKRWDPTDDRLHLDATGPDLVGIGNDKPDARKSDHKSQLDAKKKHVVKLPAPTSSSTKATEAISSGEKFTFNWDTSKFKDGNYIVKLVLDDKLSNAENNEQTSVFRTVDVDNTPPEIVSAKWTKLKGNCGQLRVEARDKQTPITNATYKLDDAEPMALAGIGDAGDGFDVTLGADNITFERHPHKVEILVSNRAGNSVTKTINVD